ncbi:MAG TPA: hypothetical protein VNO70_26875 [Blastocatellia bacterium]|nr:hypothetical protein [Blastocatellia bacterium]
MLLLGQPASGKDIEGTWVLTITIPDAPGSRDKRTFTVTLNVTPRGRSLNGRMTVTDEQNRTVGAVWRQVGKRVFISLELPCEGEDQTPCASLIMEAKLKSQGMRLKKGKVVVMWDTPNDENPALYDTSNGTFSGERIE